MENPIAIANFFIQKSFDTGRELTPMKLVKLIYISHGWYLGLMEEPLITEAVQAWKYGPMVESVYHTFRRYGSEQITSLETSCMEVGSMLPVVGQDKVPILDKIWEVYSDRDGVELSALTHQPDSPWDRVWNGLRKHKKESIIIPNNIIKIHYREKIDNYA